MAKDYKSYNLPPELVDSDNELSEVYVHLRTRLYELKQGGKTADNDSAVARCQWMLNIVAGGMKAIVGLRTENVMLQIHLTELNNENHIVNEYIKKHKTAMAMRDGMAEEVKNYKTMGKVYPDKTQ